MSKPTNEEMKTISDNLEQHLRLVPEGTALHTIMTTLKRLLATAPEEPDAEEPDPKLPPDGGSS